MKSETSMSAKIRNYMAKHEHGENNEITKNEVRG